MDLCTRETPAVVCVFFVDEGQEDHAMMCVGGGTGSVYRTK